MVNTIPPADQCMLCWWCQESSHIVGSVTSFSLVDPVLFFELVDDTW